MLQQCCDWWLDPLPQRNNLVESETLCCWKQQCFALILLQKQWMKSDGTSSFVVFAIDCCCCCSFYGFILNIDQNRTRMVGFAAAVISVYWLSLPLPLFRFRCFAVTVCCLLLFAVAATAAADRFSAVVATACAKRIDPLVLLPLFCDCRYCCRCFAAAPWFHSAENYGESIDRLSGDDGDTADRSTPVFLLLLLKGSI